MLLPQGALPAFRLNLVSLDISFGTRRAISQTRRPIDNCLLMLRVTQPIGSASIGLATSGRV